MSKVTSLLETIEKKLEEAHKTFDVNNVAVLKYLLEKSKDSDIIEVINETVTEIEESPCVTGGTKAAQLSTLYDLKRKQKNA